jgi:hypothetical protein
MSYRVDEARIRSHVRRLLEGAGAAGPPVDLHALREHLGNVDVEYAHMGDLLGSVERKAGRFRIRLNLSESRRQRFTLAHEIAHTLLMRSIVRPTVVRLRVREPARYDEQEALCDAIAAEILMPYHLFRPHVLRLPVNIEATRRLADEFDTSVQAAAIRYAHLTEQEMATIIWRQSGDSLVARVTPSKPGVRLGGQWEDRPVRDLRSGPAHALRCKHLVVTRESRSRTRRPGEVYCESLGLLSGTDRYVLSIVKTGVSPQAFQFRREQAHRSCGMASEADD